MAELATVARPYAEAALRIASENQNHAAWSEMLGLLEAVVSDENVRERIGDPNIDDRALEAFVLGTLGDRLDGHGRNFVQVLIANGRLELVPQIRAIYEQMRREHEGVAEATIVSAFPLSEEQVRTLVTTLEARLKRKVSANIEIDAELIGGVRILVGDKVIDATVRGRLEQMAAALTH
jgi:F-type H+-transporting ATPase subunit delta